MANNWFQFKQFTIQQKEAAFKVGTDGCLLGAWADVFNCQRILDVGSGTGLIALMAAQRNQKAYIDAVESDPQSALQTKENFESSPWAKRLTVYNQPLKDFSRERNFPCYDLIISNPPYFINSLKNPSERKAKARHTETLGTKEIFASANLLKKEGRIALISPFDSFIQLNNEAAAFDFFPVRHCLVSSKPGKPVERVMTEWSRVQEPPIRETLTIYDIQGNFTQETSLLLRDFYLKL